MSYDHDWADRVVRERNANVIHYQYDHMGNVTQKTDGIGNIEYFSYDAAGRLVSSTDRTGTVHTIICDLLGNPLTKTSTGWNSALTKTYTYDGMGNIITVTDAGGTIAYTYDGRGNRLTETRGNTSTTFTYNRVGSMTSSVIEIGGVVQQNVSYEYNNMGKIAKVRENSAVVTTYAYDILGRQLTAANANGVTETRVYNAAGLITSLTNTAGNTVISQYAYTYYYDGNQRTKSDASGTTEYFYDGVNRLEKTILADGTVQEYEFDNNSNRNILTVTDGTTVTETTYAYDANDRLTDKTTDGIRTWYSSDYNGSLRASGSQGTLVLLQDFDPLNRMITWTDMTTTATYTYNPDNMRRSKSVDDGVTVTVTEHVWIGTDIALDITDGTVVSYINGRHNRHRNDLYLRRQRPPRRQDNRRH